MFKIEKLKLEDGKDSLLPTGYERTGDQVILFNAGRDDNIVVNHVDDIRPGYQVAVSRGLREYMQTSPIKEIVSRAPGVVVFRTQTSLYKFSAVEEPYDVVGAIIDYETGMLDEEGTITLFQHLVNTGQAWTLQGHYGRTAKAMLDAGIIQPKGE